MNDLDKTKGELVIEIRKLRNEFKVLKEKYSTDHSQSSKAKRTKVVADKELVFQSGEKAKRAKELLESLERNINSQKKIDLAYEVIRSNKELITQAEIIGAQNEELLVINEEINQNNHQLSTAIDHAQESDRLTKAFLANMSHEIRTPMNGILGFTELLKEPGLSGAEQAKYIEIIEKSGVRMLNTINNIISISRIEAGQMEVNLTSTNLNGMLQELDDFFNPLATAKGLKLSCKKPCSDHKAQISTDSRKVHDVLINLLNNALKYTNNGTIEFGYKLRTHADGSEIEFFVKDKGIGIQKDRMEAVFHRFVQADISNMRSFQGAGLGLTISKEYVKMLRGRIWVKSKFGKGSEFYFTIPYEGKPSSELGNY